MHSNHKLGYANSKIGFYCYNQSLLPHVHKGISNAFWSMSRLSLQIKRNIFHYRTGTLLNQKHAVRFKMSTSIQCPLCQQADSALHILSGCRHAIISDMITERHNVACRLIMKAISKGSLAGCLVHLDAGSTYRLAQQNLQIPENANNRTIPRWLFGARLVDSPLVALMPFWSPPYLLKNQIEIANHSSFVPGVTTKTTQQRCTQSKYQYEGETPC